MIKDYLSSLLNSKKAYHNLLFLNIALSLIMFYIFRDQTGNDETHYLSYAQGLNYGRFSQWWFLPNYLPDTLRTPGYPVFLYFIEKISSDIYFIKAVQLLLYFLSIQLILKTAETYDSGYRLKNLVLILLLPYLQIACFTVIIQPEALMTFLLCLFIYIDSRNIAIEWKYTFLGLLSGAIYLVRPAFLFLPIFYFLINLYTYRTKFHWGLGISMLVIYFLSILPYGIWNFKNHHVVSITPIEGSGGVFHLGYWSFKMPGYVEPRYWRNTMSNEIFNFTSQKEKLKNIAAYNKEWDFIDSSCAKYLLPQDKINLAEMSNYAGRFVTYNDRYTLEREKLLRQLTIQHLKGEPGFAIGTKLFTAVRMWFTGLQLNDLHATDITKKLSAIYLTSVSGLFFLASLILIPIGMYKRKISWARSQTTIILIAYSCMAHVFFAVQSKYTIPLRLIIILLLARTIIGIFSHRPLETNHEVAHEAERLPNGIESSLGHL
jgi:hypothetical protein